MSVYIGGSGGPFLMLYRAQGTGAMLSQSKDAWALSGCICGRGIAIGWAYFGHRDFQISIGIGGD